MRWWVVRQEWGGSVLPIRAHKCSNLQNRSGGWSSKSRNARFCQFEHSCARFCRTKVGGRSAKGRNSWFCQFEHTSARIGRIEARGSRPRVEMLELAEPKWWVVVQEQEHSVLPIRALACSILQNRGGWMVGQGQERSVRGWSAKGRTEVVGGWPRAGTEVRSGQPRAETLGFANSSICVLEFVEPR